MKKLLFSSILLITPTLFAQSSQAKSVEKTEATPKTALVAENVTPQFGLKLSSEALNELMLAHVSTASIQISPFLATHMGLPHTGTCSIIISGNYAIVTVNK